MRIEAAHIEAANNRPSAFFAERSRRGRAKRGTSERRPGSGALSSYTTGSAPRSGAALRGCAAALCPGVRSVNSARWGPRIRKGFSLVEFTAVLALMAIVAGIVAVSVRPLMVKGKQDAARSEIANICSALESFYNVYGRYPTNEEGLAVLRQKTEKLTEPLLTHDPLDPWGHPYQYNTPGRAGPYEVICFGADGRPGGDGADKDIGSWNLKDNK